MRNDSRKVVQKIKRDILCSITFFRTSCPLWDNVAKYGTAVEVTGENILLRRKDAHCMSEN